MLPGMNNVINMINEGMKREKENMTDEEINALNKMKIALKQIDEVDNNTNMSQISKELRDIVENLKKEIKKDE